MNGMLTTSNLVEAIEMCFDQFLLQLEAFKISSAMVSSIDSINFRRINDDVEGRKSGLVQHLPCTRPFICRSVLF